VISLGRRCDSAADIGPRVRAFTERAAPDAPPKSDDRQQRSSASGAAARGQVGWYRG